MFFYITTDAVFWEGIFRPLGGRTPPSSKHPYAFDILCLYKVNMGNMVADCCMFTHPADKMNVSVKSCISVLMTNVQ